MTRNLPSNTEDRSFPRGNGSGRRAAALSDEWTAFRDRLAPVLAQLEEGQFLIVSRTDPCSYVQFAGQGEVGMRVEVTSNHYLKGEARLNRTQMAWLRAHGWHPPTATPMQATPEKDPDGSPNYYIDVPSPVDEKTLAWMAVEALAKGLEVPSPSELTYEAFTSGGEPLVFGDIGVRRLDRQRHEVMTKALEVFRVVTQIADLEFDDDGDISLQYGTVLLYALYHGGKLRLVSVLARKVRESLALLRKLNRFNDSPMSIRCVLRDGNIFGLADIPAIPFLPEHLAEAVPNFCSEANRLTTELRADSADHAMIMASVKTLH